MLQRDRRGSLVCMQLVGCGSAMNISSSTCRMKTAAPVPVVLHQPRVFSLQQMACLYITGNLQEFKPQHLALLPVKMRFLLMTNIPVSDILKLEHTKFTEGVDMHAVWTTVTNKTLPAEYVDFIHSPLFKGSGSIKQLYMEVLATIIFNSLCNKQSSSGYQRHRELALDLMFSVRNCLGITNWMEYLNHNPSWLTLFQTFPSESRQDRIVPMKRYKNHYIRSTTGSDMSLVTYYLSECYYFPSRISIIATPFITSAFWTDKFYPNVMERMRMFISRAESLWFSAIGDGDRISISDNITSNFPCALRFVASEILANPVSNLKNLCLQALDVVTLAALVSAVTPLLAHVKSPLAQYCVSTNHSPYRFLKEFSVAQRESGPKKESLAHTILFDCLANIIFYQECLEELSLGGLDLLMECQSYDALANAVFAFAAKPSMTILRLSDIPVLRSFLQEVVERYLQGRAKSNQILHLHNVTVDPRTILPNGMKTVVKTIIMREEYLNLKQLKLSQMYLPCRIAFWLFHPVHVFYLHTLEVHGVTIDPPYSIINVIARNLGLHVQKLCFSSIDIPRCNATAEDFRCLLTKRYLRNLSIINCNIGEKGLLQDLTTALFRVFMLMRAPVPLSFVEVLNLSENGLGRATDYFIRNFFGALFQVLVLQPNLGVDIRSNKMNPHHFSMIYVMWARCAGGRKLRQLQCQWNILPQDKNFLSQMAHWVFH